MNTFTSPRSLVRLSFVVAVLMIAAIALLAPETLAAALSQLGITPQSGASLGMATAAVGQLAMLKSPAPVNVPPIVGRVAVVATNANIIWTGAPAGGPFMNTIVNGAITLTDAQLLDALDVVSGAGSKPGAIGTLNWFGANGPVEALVLGAWEVVIPAAAKSPFDGSTNAGVRHVRTLYVEVCKQCNQAAAIALGGERFFLIDSTQIDEGAYVPSGAWTEVSPGGGVPWASTNA